MAKFGPWTNAYCLINLVDLSKRVESLTLSLVKDDIDITSMGDGGHTHVGGLENDKLQVTFWADYAAAQVDATLLPIFQAGTAVAFKCAPAVAPFSTTNPTYSGSVVITQYDALAGKVGDGLQASVTFVVSGTVTEGTT